MWRQAGGGEPGAGGRVGVSRPDWPYGDGRYDMIYGVYSWILELQQARNPGGYDLYSCMLELQQARNRGGALVICLLI